MIMNWGLEAVPISFFLLTYFVELKLFKAEAVYSV